MKESAFFDALEQGSLERASELLQKLSTELTRPRFLYLESLLLRRKKEHSEAMKRLDMALVLHLSDPELWAAKASLLEEMGKLDMAKRAADRACRLSPDSFDHRMLCANILYSLKDFRSAMEQVDRALTIDPRSAKALILKGILISLLDQDHLGALKYFDSAVEVAPDNADAWTNRGITLRQIGDRDGAIFSLQKALLSDRGQNAALEALRSIGAEQYIPGEAPRRPETVGQKVEVNGRQDDENVLPPEEWGEEDAFEPVNAPDVKHGKAPKGAGTSKKGTDGNEEGAVNEGISCPRCGEVFLPRTDTKGRFECPSCSLRGRIELD